MLKKRIIGVIIVKNNIAVQSISFSRYLPLGSVVVTAEYLCKWGIDEIIVLDIDATKENRGPNFAMVTQISSRVFVPLTIGGGIKSLDDIRMLIHAGADKVSINNAALKSPRVIENAVKVFGAQCIVASIDVKKCTDGKYTVWCNSGTVNTGRDPVLMAKKYELLGVGEVLLNFIDRDGLKCGFDNNLVAMISDAINIPVIACGGIGEMAHFFEGITKGKASAVAAGNYFNFSEHSPIVVKSYLIGRNIDVRLETHAKYKDAQISKVNGRIGKKEDAFLEKIKFEYQHDEVI